MASGNQYLNDIGWLPFIHPDLLWNTSLAKTIKTYEFFGYAGNEALFLSEREEAKVLGIIANIEHEYRANRDTFSQDILIAQLELLLSCSQRFYHRQFLTHKITNHRILHRLKAWLTADFERDNMALSVLPTVQAAAQSLNISPHYFRNLRKRLTGPTTQQHIEKAREVLSTTDLTVTEIAFRLGFEHSQSFSKLFKNKTRLSPLEFRKSVFS